MKNFGIIYESIKTDSSILLSNKKLLKEFVKTIKSDKILLDEWKFYSELLNNKEEDLKLYIQEGINHFKKYSRQDIDKSNQKLNKLLESFDYTPKHSVIYDNIDNIIKEETKIDNINDKINVINQIHNYITENKLINIPILKENKITSKTIKLIGKRICEKYDSILNEDDKLLLNTILKAKTKGDKVTLHESLKKDCLNMVNDLIKENSEDIKVKEKFLTLKEQLLDESFDDNTFNDSILNLVSKKNVLKEIKEDIIKKS